jgi:hypothetical protein
VPSYLSPEWLEALDVAARDVVAEPDVTLTLQAIVHGGPAGDVIYAIEVTSGTVRVTPDAHPTPDVVLQQSYETAAAVASGRTNALEALQRGEIAIEGDVQRLRAAQPALSALDTAAADLRAETTF